MGGCGGKKRRERERRERLAGVNIQAETSPPNVQAVTGKGKRELPARRAIAERRDARREDVETKGDREP